ncbi:hypothetical protein S7711_10766 [Stachybotrys chartarum IBT 7711]|uniref:Uncharacterized protein n=1 Tax=Stachybotrys chartarum (strain CBS 109288 / IBT 7711) TaxID=1280523 RepID=A0A084AU82_STACB|nr:hypothetical protein S7711_10766 [Stachybotrys chartarum IBT 7711]
MALEEAGAMHDFLVADWNADGCPGLIAFILQEETALNLTLGFYEFKVADWTRNGRLDFVGSKKWSTGTNSIEVHIIAG